MSPPDIAALMYIYGDVKVPRLSSVELMTNILRDQMNLLLLKVEENVSRQKGTIISHGDVLFIVRKNEVKLKRLLEHLKALDLKSGFSVNLDLLDTLESSPNPQGYLKMCMDFLISIEDLKEFSSILTDETIIDVSTMKRRMRQHWKINMMDPYEQEEYLKFFKEMSRPFPQFKEWLLKNEVTALDLTDCALIIMEFLARETVAEIIDMVLLMKMRKLGKGPYLLRDYNAQLVQVESEWKADICDTLEKIIEEPYSWGRGKILNNNSNGTQSDSFPVYDDELSKGMPSNPSESTRHAIDVLSDVSDDHYQSEPDLGSPISHHNDEEVLDMSDTDLSESLQDKCNLSNLNQDSQGSKLNYDLSDISDESDTQNNECETDNRRTPHRRKRRKSSCHSEAYVCDSPTEVYSFDSSTATNHLSVSAKNEVEFISPVESYEIADAFVRFQELSPLEDIFNPLSVPRNTKLICLFDSFSFDIL